MKNKNEKALTLLSLIVTIILLLILASIAIVTLTGDNGLFLRAKQAKKNTVDAQEQENITLAGYEEQISKYVLNGEIDNDYISKDIEDFTPTIVECSGTYILAKVENIKVNNGNKICAYIWILNGKVVGGTSENSYKYVNLESSKEYVIQVVAVDENCKLKISKAISAKTADRIYLYAYGKTFEGITGGLTHINRTRYGGCSVTFDNDKIYIDAYSNGGGGGIVTNKAIDLTEYRYIKAKGEMTEYAYGDSYGRILATSSSNLWGSSVIPNGNTKYSCSKLEKGELILENDISSLTGEYYIMNGFNQSRGYIYEIWLEK
mgnify:FL=1